MLRGLHPSAPQPCLKPSSTPPLKCMPTQQPRDALHIPSPAEDPAFHLCCLSLWSGPGGASCQTPSGCGGHMLRAETCQSHETSLLIDPETRVPRVGPSGRQLSREGCSGLATDHSKS